MEVALSGGFNVLLIALKDENLKDLKVKFFSLLLTFYLTLSIATLEDC